MAQAFLASHGIDIDKEMQRIQFGQAKSQFTTDVSTTGGYTETTVINASLPHAPPGSLWDVHMSPSSGTITSIQPGSANKETDGYSGIINARTALLAPSLCHPHIHLDKAYLLSHPRYSHLRIEKGDFAEAMSLTGQAKAKFQHADLLERGQRVIDESVSAGVTHMRAFVELDAGVGTKCLDAALELKKLSEGRLRVQICAFAQLPLFSPSQGDVEGEVIRELMQRAASMKEVEALGSTPYVEADRKKMERNVEWLVDLAISHKKHIDYHLDYNLDSTTEPLVWHVISTLKSNKWPSRNPNRTIILGHCTRLTLVPTSEWQRLKPEIGSLPLSFVGLPTSDLFMMRTEDRVRGTLDVPNLVKEYGLNACLGINNIGNAFTPHGSCDPLTLACNGVGVYQAGTERDAETLYECVSTRARTAIGLGGRREDDKDIRLGVKEGDEASLLLFGHETPEWRTRKSVSEAVYLYDHCKDRRVFLEGKAVT